MTPVAAAIAAHFGIQAKQARIVAVLYAAGGEFVDSRTLWEACGIPSRNGLSVQAWHLRAHFVPVEADKGRGYRLTAAGLEQCRAGLLAHAACLEASAAGLRCLSEAHAINCLLSPPLSGTSIGMQSPTDHAEPVTDKAPGAAG